MYKCRLSILDCGHGDCILLQFNNGYFNILIDSGPKNILVTKKLESSLISLLGKRLIIDIAVVTHSDDDHIGGFTHLIKGKIEFKEFWFNSPELISSTFPNELGNKVSFNQADKLDVLLDKYPVRMVSAGLQYSYLNNAIEFNILSPLTDDLVKYGKKIIESRKIKKQKVAAETIDIDELQELSDVFKEDSSIPNRSSIAFIVKYEDISLLFLADSHPSVICSSLEKLEITDISPASFNLVKVSHHGSAKNTNNELLQLIRTKQFAITSNGKKHGLPNKVTFDRILAQSPFEKAEIKFCFSSGSKEIKKLFSDNKNICCDYPSKDGVLSYEY